MTTLTETVIPPTSAGPLVQVPSTGAALVTTAVVPPAVQLAAKRGFVRTFTQALAGSVPAGGVTAAMLYGLMTHPDWKVIAASAGAFLLAPAIAGAVSWLSILSQGVPQEYTNVVSVAPTTGA